MKSSGSPIATPPSPGSIQTTTPVGGPGFRRRFVDERRRRGSYPRWVLVATLAGMFANGFPFTILAVSLGEIAAQLETTETVMMWVITGPLLFSAVSLPVLGKLGDLRGHRKIYLVGSTLAAATAVVTAFAWSAPSLIGLRTFAAVVGAATQPCSMALIFSVFPPGRRTQAMGWWSMVGAGAPAMGLIVGGPLVDLLGWRTVFSVQAVFAFAALGLAWLVLAETERLRVRFDLPGAASLAVGVGGAMVALSQVRDHALTSPRIAVPLAFGVVGLAAFLWIERRAPAPLLPLELFLRRNFTAPILSSSLMGSAYMGAFVLAPLVLRQFGFSITAAAAIMVLRTLSLSLSSPFGGYLGDRFGERPTALIGTGLVTGSMLLLAFGSSRVLLPVVGVGLVLQGVGQGLCLPSLNSTVASSVPPEHIGIATAASRLTNQVGTSFGITLLTLAATGAQPTFGRAFLLGALLAALSVIAATQLQSRAERLPPSGR